MKSAIDLLQKYWKHKVFREPQKEIIDAVINNSNVLALLPTGAGKSLCFQIPALLKPGVCIVISPLIALMEDQVDNLQKKGIKAIALTSKYNIEKTIQAFDNILYGDYKFLYLSPEKLQSEFIQEKIKQLQVNLITVDEAHCISQWGHDFRPAYLKINTLKEIHPDVNIIALTASATSLVIEDIKDQLELKNVQTFKKSLFRKNLEIQMIFSEDIYEKLKNSLIKIKGSIIVYTGTRKNCVQISNYLNRQGLKSTYYHGGLGYDQKIKHQNAWMNENIPIIVATNAFGMGIDKSNVRAIIHTNIPNSIENYTQEIGRAGRDGLASVSKLLFNNGTIADSQNYVLKSIANTAFCKEVYIKLNEYYQIGNGEFLQKKVLFNLQDFCTKYELTLLRTFSAMHFFELENIIEINQNYGNKSSLKMIVSNRYLLEYEKRNPKQEELLKIILRNYGGAFEQFIPVNESFLANKLSVNIDGIKPNKYYVVSLLKQLHKDKIIFYKEAGNDAELQFLAPREDRFIMHSISKNIEFRNKIKIDKAQKMIDLIQNNSVCRNIQLSYYFGDKNDIKCRICDVCKAEHQPKVKTDHTSVATEILVLFDESKQLSVNEIIIQLSFDKNSIIKTLQLLIEKNTLRLTSQNKFEKVQ